VTVNKADQTITFAPLAGEALNSAPFTVSATGGGSTNPVTFSSTTTAVCTVSGSTVTLIAAGICTVAANQAGDDNYNAAAEVDQSFTVSSAPVIAMAFQPAAILPNSSTSLVFTLTNPSGNVVPQTGVAFSDTLPAGISVADATTTVCGGTLTTSAATGVIALSGARIEVNSQCQFSVSVTATSGSFVNTSGPVSSSNGGTGNSATATLNAGTASLAVTVTDNSDYARYGQTRNYLLTITNNGSTNATDIGVMQTVSDDFDASGITWTCINGGGTSCTASGTGPLTDSNIVIPPTRSLSWLITASVLFDAPDDSAQTTFTVTSAQDPNAPYVATDSDTLVVFRDGFEVANGDGTGALVQTAETPSSSVLAIPLTIGQSVMLTMPAVAGSSLVDTLMRARAVDGSGFRVERLNFGAPRVRLVSIDSIGVEHAGVWITAAANENVGVGLTDSQGTTAVMETNGGEETLHLSTATQPTYGVAISVDSSVTQ
jgi:uncharacterized repeat protein (TIGR01451 family)